MLLLIFSNRVLQANAGIEYGLELIQWELAGTLFLGWVIVYLIVWRGLHQSGYIIWFTALFPYFVMITLLVRALTLEGAVTGLQAYINVRCFFITSLTFYDLQTSFLATTCTKSKQTQKLAMFAVFAYNFSFIRENMY